MHLALDIVDDPGEMEADKVEANHLMHYPDIGTDVRKPSQRSTKTEFATN